jgi:predicted transcriptional regulator
MARQQNVDLAFRTSAELREAIEHIAQAQQRTISWIVRDALQQYVTEHETDLQAAS